MIAVFGLGLMSAWCAGHRSTMLAIMMHGAWNLMVGIGWAMSV